MGASIVDRSRATWANSRESARIGLSDFTHGRKWRSELVEVGTMEIIDRDKTCGWILSCECLDALMLRMGDLEERLERAEVAAIIAERAEKAHYASGDEAARDIAAAFDERYGEWLEDLDAGER